MGLIVTASPHIRHKDTVAGIMWWVFLALVPAGIVGVYVFGGRALALIIACVLGAVAIEAVVQLLMRKPITIYDGSAAVTGLLLAYNLPADVPIWVALIGTLFAILVAKHFFGGLGKNIFNPALAGRAFLMASYPLYMTRYLLPTPNGLVTGATPLMALKEAGTTGNVSYKALFFGNVGGCIGETSALALLAGAFVLFYKRIISWHIPITYILTVALFTWCFGGRNGLFTGDAIFHMLAGGLFLGAFFMATDMVTSPMTKKGQIVFGIGCGIITSIIRLWGGYPEGVSYSILVMNACVPLIDAYIRPRRLGERRMGQAL